MNNRELERLVLELRREGYTEESFIQLSTRDLNVICHTLGVAEPTQEDITIARTLLGVVQHAIEDFKGNKAHDSQV